MKEQRNKENKIAKGIIIILCIFIVIYLGMLVYFADHFYFGTIINYVDVSGKTVEEAEKKMEDEFSVYTLELQERNNKKEKIKGANIKLKYNSNGEIQALKNEQNPFKWIFESFNTKESKIAKVISYDEELLKKYFDNLTCFNSSNIIEPKNPTLQYTDNGYIIIDEVYGNKVNKDTLYNVLVNSILMGKKTLDLESMNCYENPKYTLNSKEVIDAKNNLDKYTSSKITYTFGKLTEVLDGSTINTWLKVDENFQVIFDEKKVKNYLTKLSNTYSTYGKTRRFVTSLGTTVEVSGGNYGWLIDRKEEEKVLIEAIKEGGIITKEPIYSQTAVSHEENDIGNTYVEINMTKQYLWFYIDGVLVVAGDVVTGNVSNGNSTPVGTFRLNYKQKGATLSGENYRTSVKFWMPFYGNIGIHDASWRGAFGGSIYKTNGSHGCVNTPYYLASTIFNYIEEGTPIICYYK